MTAEAAAAHLFCTWALEPHLLIDSIGHGQAGKRDTIGGAAKLVRRLKWRVEIGGLAFSNLGYRPARAVRTEERWLAA